MESSHPEFYPFSPRFCVKIQELVKNKALGWTGSTVTAASEERGRTLLSPAVVTSAVKAASILIKVWLLSFPCPPPTPILWSHPSYGPRSFLISYCCVVSKCSLFPPLRTLHCVWSQLQLPGHLRPGWFNFFNSMTVTDSSTATCSLPSKSSVPHLYILSSPYITLPILEDEASGAGVLQRPCEAHSFSSGAHSTGSTLFYILC